MKPSPERRRGAAAVELAILLPTLLVIVIGCVDFGRIASASIALNSAVGAGGAYAAAHRFSDETKPDWEQRIREVIIEELPAGTDLEPDSLVIAISTETAPDDSLHMTIDVSLPFRTVVDWPGVPHLTLLHQRLAVTSYR